MTVNYKNEVRISVSLIKRVFSFKSLMVVCTFVLFVSSCYAGAPGWQVIALNKGAPFVSAYPVREEGTFSQRSKPQLAIQKTAQGKVVAVYVGYPLKENSPVTVTIGKEKFKFYSHGEWAFVDKDEVVIGAMLKGRDFIVEATSQKGTISKDTYSLMGLTKVLKELS